MYRKVCGAKGPSVTLPVVLAFLLPLVVFIASLVVFTSVLPGAKDESGSPTAVSLLPALFATLACMWGTRALRRRFGHSG
ncbi:MAG: SoxR reducing system RseC family protein [Sedimentisphaerales bacterium]